MKMPIAWTQTDRPHPSSPFCQRSLVKKRKRKENCCVVIDCHFVHKFCTYVYFIDNESACSSTKSEQGLSRPLSKC